MAVCKGTTRDAVNDRFLDSAFARQTSAHRDTPGGPRRSFVANIDGIYVGMVRYEDKKWRFIAATPRFSMLDGKRFSGEEVFYQVARTLARLIFGNTLSRFLTKPVLSQGANDP